MKLVDYLKLEEKRNRGKVAASEHDLQVGCVNIFRVLYPELSHLLMAIPNGGWRNATTAAKLKAEGVIAGVPDLFLAIPRGEYHGLWIEMKNGKAGRLSDAQKNMIELLRSNGYKCEVCHSALDFRAAVQKYME